RLLDLLHEHADCVAEPVGAAGPAADEGGAELVQLEVVARQAAGRQEALEDLAEASEQAGADQADDLAVEGLVPAALVELVVEQPGEAELVREVLDLRRLALAARDVLGQVVEVRRRRLVGETELA